MNWNEFQEKIVKIDGSVNPVFDWEKFDIKNPLKVIDLEKTTFDLEFDKDFINKEIEIKIEISGNASVFTSGINAENFSVKPSIFGEIKKHDSVFKYSISPTLSMEGNILKNLNNTGFHLEYDKSLMNEDVKFTVKVDGKTSVFTSGVGEMNATAMITIKH